MTKRSSRPAVLLLPKLKGESGANLPSLSKARLKELIEQAIVDAYGEEEEVGGFFTMIEEYLALPFPVKVLGVDIEVEKVDMTRDGRCRLSKEENNVVLNDAKNYPSPPEAPLPSSPVCPRDNAQRSCSPWPPIHGRRMNWRVNDCSCSRSRFQHSYWATPVVRVP
jgi:hypothetical protein